LADLVPFRWPASWHDPAQLDAIRDTPFNCAVGDDIAPAVAAEMSKCGVTVTSFKNAPALLLEDARWPQVRMGAYGDADAGPTGEPWIDSNGFAIQAARGVSPGKPVWVPSQPPAKRVLNPNDFLLAVCDAAAYGAKWLPSPDVAAWPQIVAAQRLFSEHSAWREYRTVARLAVVSDFAKAHRDLAVETLNLLTRLYVPFEVLPKGRASALTRFAMVLNIDDQPASTDPWELATRIHAKLGRKNDVVRLWNGGSLNLIYTVANDGQSGLLQAVNYAAHEPGEAVSVWVLSQYRSARIYTLDRPQATPIDLHPASGGVEIYLPPFPVYAAIELIK